MANLRTLRALETEIMVDEAVTGDEVEALREEIYADGKVDRTEAEILIELYKKTPRIGPGFKKFFFKALREHVLYDGSIRAAEAVWLREQLSSMPGADDRKKKLLTGERHIVGGRFNVYPKQVKYFSYRWSSGHPGNGLRSMVWGNDD